MFVLFRLARALFLLQGLAFECVGLAGVVAVSALGAPPELQSAAVAGIAVGVLFGGSGFVIGTLMRRATNRSPATRLSGSTVTATLAGLSVCGLAAVVAGMLVSVVVMNLIYWPPNVPAIRGWWLATFGGEVTGHYYFRDNFFADNGFIPALLILELMSKKGKSLRELLEPLRSKYFISGEINTKLASMDAVAPKLNQIAERYADGSQYKLDGISVEYPDWHFNVRASNTEPLLRLNLEAKTQAMMEQKRDEVLAVIRQA